MHLDPSSALRSRAARLTAAAAVVGALLGAGLPATAQAASTCSTTTASGGYTVQTCLSPSSGTVTGTITPSVTVTVSTTSVRVSFVTFCLDGSVGGSPSCVDGGAGYLLRAFQPSSQPSQTQSVWKFSLPTAHWVDGSHALRTVVTMRDGTRTASVTAALTFSNGKTTQPINNAKPSIHKGTTPASGSPFVVAAVGDAASGESTATSVASQVKSWSPNLFLYLGDVYEMGSYAEFTNWYAKAYGSLKSITDPVIGNHEYLSATDPATSSSVSPAHIAYFDYWNNLPNYYSFNAGGWHFIALNSNSSQIGSTAWKAELSWLQNDLAANASACTIAFWHHPAFNIGTEPVPGSAMTIWSTLAGKATLVLNGHDHTYQRWAPMNASGTVTSSGTVEIVDGTGGHSIATFASSDSRVRAKSTAAGALRLSLSPTSVKAQFVATSGTVIDSTTVPCL